MILFSRNFILKMYAYPYDLKFSDPLPETLFFFIWPDQKAEIQKMFDRIANKAV